MARNPKVFFHNSLHFVTTSVEEGFMFPANPLVTEIIKKSIAQAQELYAVKISDLLVQSTHVHMFIQIIDPQDAVNFMKTFKAESAHAINRLLGRKKRTVWCEGYDSPLIADLETAIDRIAYIYSNPSNDNLVDKIEQFPGFNTFNLHIGQTVSFIQQETSKEYPTYYLARNDFKPLGDQSEMTVVDYQRYRDALIDSKKKNYFRIDPCCWMVKFGIRTDKQRVEVSKRIISRVREQEGLNREKREKAKGGSTIVGVHRLVNQIIGGDYRPQREGKRMLVHSVDLQVRKSNIAWIKDLITKGKECLERWRQGDMSVPYPMGLFPPTGPRLIEPLGW